mmetsp:Transcript_18681/g.58743  ORF Transcript_18681/g.58743 Transcript_18681/m.58743 type:complete len:977 (+) Transcript_18681:175-3105(+)
MSGYEGLPSRAYLAAVFAVFATVSWLSLRATVPSPSAGLGAVSPARRESVFLEGFEACSCYEDEPGLGASERRPPRREAPTYKLVLEAAAAWMAIMGLAYIGLAEVFYAAMKLRNAKSLESTILGLLNYRLENWWARSSTAIPLSLAYVTLCTNMLGGLIYSAFTGESLGTAIFKTWTFLCDPAAHTELDTMVATCLGVALTLLGMIICGFLISIITDLVAERVAAVKKGNSHVIEAGHTLILGYSDGSLRPLIAQIAIANESEGGGVVVLLASRPNEFLQKEMSYLKDELKTTSIVVRSGSPLRTTDLDIVSPRTAKCIIILANNEVSAEESDAVVMRTVLALSAFESLDGHIVAELRDVDNEDHISLISRHPIECVVAHDFIGRLMIQCARQRDLALVLDCLLGYLDNEIYIDEWPELVGRSFLQVTRSFDYAIPIGLKRASDGSVIINPPRPDDVLVEEGDEIIVIAEDNDSYAPLPEGPVADVEVDPAAREPRVQSTGPMRRHICRELPAQAKLVNAQYYDSQRPQHFLFLGWRRDVMDMIRFLDEILSVGSSLTIMSTMPVSQRLIEMAENGRKLDLNTIALHHVVGNHVSRRQLAQLPLLWYDAILILSEKSQEAKVLATDSLTCASLVLVRDIQAHKQCRSRPPSPNVPALALPSSTSPPPTSPRGVCAMTSTLVDGPTEPKTSSGSTVRIDLGAQQVEPRGSALTTPSQQSPTLEFRQSLESMRSERSERSVDASDGDGAARSGSGRRPSARGQRRESAVLYRLLDSQGGVSSDDDDDDTYTPTTRESHSQLGRRSGRRGHQSGASSTPTNLHAVKKKKRSQKAHREVKTQIICELLDSTRWDQLHRFCDVVASNDFTSRILAMVSERAETNQVLHQLLSQRGSEILVRPLRDYAEHGEKLNFYELAARALLCGDICIGYKRADASNRQKFVLNPRDKFLYLTWSKDDRIAVIGYDHTVRSSEALATS